MLQAWVEITLFTAVEDFEKNSLNNSWWNSTKTYGVNTVKVELDYITEFQ
jgi:hypothetical protein